MNTINVNVIGVCNTVLATVKVENAPDVAGALYSAQLIIQDHPQIDAADIVKLECEGVIYSKYIFSIQLWSKYLGKEFFVDGYVLAENPLIARNVAQVQANAIVGNPESKQYQLELMGLSLQPIFEVVS